MSFELDFLTRKEVDEVALRTAKEREKEDARFHKATQNLLMEYRNRGLLESGQYRSAIIHQKVVHQRQLCRIQREAIFEIIEQRGLTLSDANVEQLVRFLRECHGSARTFLERELDPRDAPSGGMAPMLSTLRTQFDQAIDREARIETRVRAAELARSQEVKRKEERRVHKKEIAMLVIGGFLGTILTMFGSALTRSIDVDSRRSEQAMHAQQP